MKTEVKKLDNGRCEILISLSGDVVKNKFEEAFKKVGQSAKLAGFRAGHVPRELLEKNFSGPAQEAVIESLIPQTYEQAITQEKIDALDLPKITEVKLDRANLSFKATVEVRPEIKVSNYKGIVLEAKKIEVTPDEIKRAIDAIKESHKLDYAEELLARSLGYPGCAELDQAVEKQLYLEKANVQRQSLENAIIKAVTKDLHFHLPQAMVNGQMQDMLRQVKVELVLKGLSREAIDKEEKNISEKLLPEAKRQVSVYLVLAQIAKQENIAIDEQMPHKVIELLLREAMWQEAC
jgi:FKBP-type peptidyl-prolyl cis-trans isomerase (trigger factor)